jgi:replicative DNA helicase
MSRKDNSKIVEAFQRQLQDMLSSGIDPITYLTGKELPKDKNLEMMVLGACLVDELGYPLASQVIDKKVFYYPESQALWGIIETLSNRREKIDIATVTSEAKGTIDVGFVMECSMKVSSADHTEAHSRVLYERFMERELQKYSIETMQSLGVTDVIDIVEELERKLVGLWKVKTEHIDTGATLVEKMQKDARKNYDAGDQMLGDYFTGIKSLDEAIGGLEPGDLMVIGGRPGMGKSSMQNTMNRYSILNNIPVYSASGEMTNLKMGYRAIGALSGFPTNDVQMGKFFGNDKDMLSVDEAFEKMKKSPILFDGGQLSVPKARKQILLHKSISNTKIFMFDRLGLFQEVTSVKDGVAARNNVMAELRAIATAEGVSIILFSQLVNRVEDRADKRPILSDFYGGGGTPANVTKAMMVYRPIYYGMDTFPSGPFEGEPSKGRVEMIIEKNTFGGKDSVLIGFNPLTQSYYELGDAPEQLSDYPASWDIPRGAGEQPDFI